MFRHLLVATDGSSLSNNAVDKAVLFASEVKARITFIHVEQPVPAVMYGEGLPSDAPEELAGANDSAAQQILSRCVTQATDAGVQCDCLAKVSRAPYEAIIAAAEETGCDIIFMASHGRRGLSGLLIGSETQKVLTHSKIPVLVYR